MGAKLVIVGLAVLCLAAAKRGCGGDEEDDLTSEAQALAEDAGDSTGAADTATSIVSIPILPLATAASVASATAAVAAAAGTGTFFKPAGCVTATTSGLTVTYEFKGCTGPFGLVAVNGKLSATFGPAAGGVKIEVKSDGLTLNQTQVEQQATATVTYSGSVRTITWNGGYKGVTYRGKHAVQHTASYTTELDTATSCVKWNGSGSTTVDARGLTVSVTGYERCGSIWVCPKTGRISATNKSGTVSITLEYLGGGKARLTGPRGNTWDYKMLWCVAQ